MDGLQPLFGRCHSSQNFVGNGFEASVGFLFGTLQPAIPGVGMNLTPAGAGPTGIWLQLSSQCTSCANCAMSFAGLAAYVKVLLDLVQRRCSKVVTFSGALHQFPHLLFKGLASFLFRRLNDFPNLLNLRLCPLEVQSGDFGLAGSAGTGKAVCPGPVSSHRGSPMTQSLNDFRLILWSIHCICHASHLQYQR